MSLHVVIIPEDATYDASILKPVITALFMLLEKPSAKIQVINGNPKIGGKSQQQSQLDAICDKYKNAIIIIARDNDCVEGTQVETSLDAYCESKQAENIKITNVIAMQELEAWLLVNQKSKLTKSVKEIREDCHLKENLFAPFMKTYGNNKLPDEGRGNLISDNLNIKDLITKCDELGRLKTKLEKILAD